jgi:malonate decarboxylase alpha subunit
MNKKRKEKLLKLKHTDSFCNGKIVNFDDTIKLLETVIKPGDKVCLEGNNQKQAEFLAKSLAEVDPDIIHSLHMIQATIALPEHLDLFDLGIAEKVDFAFCGRQSKRIADMIASKSIKIGAVHTYLELYGRLFTDLTPKVALLCAEQADKEGNLFFGCNSEDSPTLIEATTFSNGIVIVQVNEIVDKVTQVDVSGSMVDFVIESPKPFSVDPLFTRDPANINEIKVLMAMMTLKGIYAEYAVKTINHGVGFNTAAIELILPTYGNQLGLKGKICNNWILNPHPTMIPAIEDGWVDSIFPPGGEVGMDKYIKNRTDIFFTGTNGVLHSGRASAQVGGHYGIDIFTGATLQMDIYGNSSTATTGRLAGFGGAPNFGCDNRGRRHESEAMLKAGHEAGTDSRIFRGRKLVVQMIETFQEAGHPSFVEELDATAVAKDMNIESPPIMIYGDDITHIVTEEGIANLLLCRTLEEREQAVRGVAAYTPVGLKRNKKMVEELRKRGVIRRPEDMDIQIKDASRDLLAARNIRDLVEWSDGLYNPPVKFRDW